MSYRARIIIAFLILIISQAGCSTYIRNSPRGYKVSRTYEADFETTWSAVNQAMKIHPVITTDKGQGILMTDWVQGTTPLYIRRERISFFGRERAWDMGALFANITPDTVYVVHVNKGQPAEAAGLLPYDIILEANERKITTSLDITNIMKERPTRITFRILRVGISEPFTYHVSPGLLSQNYSHSTVPTKYKLNIRVLKAGKNETEVRIISDEEGFFRPLSPDEEFYRQQTGKIRKADYQRVESSTFRERLILDEIEKHLRK